MTVSGKTSNGEFVVINLNRWQLVLSIILGILLVINSGMGIRAAMDVAQTKDPDCEWTGVKHNIEELLAAEVVDHCNDPMAHPHINQQLEDIKKAQDTMNKKLDMVIDHMMNGK